MNQNDFRKLVSSHSLVNTSLRPSSGASSSAARDGDASSAAAKRKERKHVQPLRKKKDTEAEASKPTAESHSGPAYRDRALERRVTEAKLIPDASAEEERMLEDIDYERSKFMGGDLAHTHLVKGLDFALLHKLRAEQDASGTISVPREAAPAAPVEANVETVSPFLAAILAADACLTRAAPPDAQPSAAAVCRHDALWRDVAVYCESVRREREKGGRGAYDRFAPWVMTYDVSVCDASRIDEEVELPTVVLHGEADVDADEGRIVAPIHATLLQRIAQACSRTAAVIAGPAAVPTPAAKVVDEDEEDIFAGAGLYTAAVTPAVIAAASAAAGKSSSIPAASVLPSHAPMAAAAAAAPPAHKTWQDDEPAPAVVGTRKYASLDEYERALARKGGSSWRREEDEERGGKGRKKAKLDGQLKQIQRKIEERKAGGGKPVLGEAGVSARAAAQSAAILGE